MRKTIFLLILAFCGLSLSAQRLELRFNKEFSNDSLLNKTLGGGASFIIDGWHPNLDFQINFDYAGHNGKTNAAGISQRLVKFKAGVSALYTRPLGKRFFIRAGGDVSYNNLKNVVTNQHDTTVVSGDAVTSVTYRSNMLGIGAVVQFQVALGNIVRVGLGVTPTYLIPLSAKVSVPNREPAYNKGLFDLQLQVGLEIKLNNNN